MTARPAAQPPERLRRLPSRLLTRTAAQVQRLVAEGLGEYRTHHYALMAAAAELGPASQAALGQACGMDRSDVVAALDDLTARGLVRRAPDPADRRRNTVVLTGNGERALHELDARVQEVQQRAFSPLTPDERAVLADLLARVNRHHAEAE
ncbi:MarR family winged helix-turn-helix transcriptional regulator [Nocardiopsis halophila]|uniref:MarR family winged helix-turn-helix transcriptional regulator n=1 Tax=Nocardiopsis halophila TaxID=141692 RepID=UPI00034C2DB5|nr:MarR family winged helix-turn-helix transcriptional regulator [Nocardiopsis halophila]